MTHEYPDREATIALLTDWQKHHAAVTRLMDGIVSSIGMSPDSTLYLTVWNLFDAYTDTLAVEIGDLSEWLDWYRLEHDMGAKKMQAGYDGQLIAIESLGDLCRLIEISRERGVE